MSTTKQSQSVSSALAVLCNKTGKHFIFENKNIIGRNPSAFLCITESFISRKHCVIEKKEDDKFIICDTSNSGTFVNNIRLVKNQPQELSHLDRISLGGTNVYSYVFLINKKRVGVKTPERAKKCSALTEKMVDLNETQSLEKDSVDKELNLVEVERRKLEEEFQQKLKAQQEELEKERLNISLVSVQNKELVEKAEIKLKESMDEKGKITKEYEEKIADVTKKVYELQKTKDEMEKRHQLEREELESKCKAEIEELKMKLEISELQHQQFEELQARLEDTKSVLLESELEQQRLFEAKVEVETKLESKIIDLTSESENKAEQVKELEKKLKEKEELEERVKREIEGLEDDMMCSICAELYIEPTAVNCGHMFCKLCITEWSKKKKICPMCRAKIITTVRIYNMDSVIQRNIRLMSEEARSRRETLIAERTKAKTPKNKRVAKKRRHEATQERTAPLEVETIGFRIHAPPQLEPHRPREEVDPFRTGWVRNPVTRNVEPAEGLPLVSIAAIDLTTLPTLTPVANRTRTHTVTSADANSTIDLTDL